MREIIKIHCGQFGINIADELYTQEEQDFSAQNERFNHLTSLGNYQPRAILMDHDFETMNNFMVRGRARHLIDTGNCITAKTEGYGGHCNDFSTAYNNQKHLEGQLRKQLELCDNPEGFIIFNSFSNSVGSAMPVWIQEMNEKSDKKQLMF